VERNRLAYRTVGKMYDQSWCPSADQMTCTVNGSEVTISLVAGNVDSAILYRDGNPLTVLGAALAFTDRPLPGAHVYSLVAESDRAQCTPISCTVNLQSNFRRGDTSPNGTVDITDVVAILNYLYLGGRLDCPRRRRLEQRRRDRHHRCHLHLELPVPGRGSPCQPRPVPLRRG